MKNGEQNREETTCSSNVCQMYVTDD